MSKKKRKKRVVQETEDFGTCELYCKDCDYVFEVDWETIFAEQECTHGYVGFYLNDVLIECPKCHKTISGESEGDALVPDTRKTKQNKTIIDDELPF
ncbi:hypothetical protein [Evansella tamaricis]|uniref:Uncharacterized protein n=1 Tax=Evansella tamaricis TaxID=2069301 RepID=A0ABS6JJ78_9BACI|nr:hypothetical protein [Evansella tamaricis]MBU9713445.1 hypothetical protein [Evansella tamaricis]